MSPRTGGLCPDWLHRPVAKGLSDVVRRNVLVPRQVRDRAGDLGHAMIGARGEAQRRPCRFQELPCLAPKRGDRRPAAQLCIARTARMWRMPPTLPFGRALDPTPNGRGILSVSVLSQMGQRNRRECDVEIDAIEQRTRERQQGIGDNAGQELPPWAANARFY